MSLSKGTHHSRPLRDRAWPLERLTLREENSFAVDNLDTPTHPWDQERVPVLDSDLHSEPPFSPSLAFHLVRAQSGNQNHG